MSTLQEFQDRERQCIQLYRVATKIIADICQSINQAWALCGDSAYTMFYHHGQNANAPQVIEVMLLSATSTTVLSLKQILATKHRNYFHSHNSKLLFGPKNVQGICIEVLLYLPTTLTQPRAVRNVQGTPVVPFLFLLLQKLSAWELYRGPARDQYAIMILRMINQCNPVMLFSPSDADFCQHLVKSLENASLRFRAQFPSASEKWDILGFPPLVPVPVLQVQAQTVVAVSPKSDNSLAAPDASSKQGTKKKKKTEAGSLSYFDIRLHAARATVNILRQAGYACAIFGSMACKMYGNDRLPNDVDMLVLPPSDHLEVSQEDIKTLIISADPDHFFLQDPRDPEAIYKVLYYVPNPSKRNTKRYSSSKVDILLPGVMDLPLLTQDQIKWRKRKDIELPLVPFEVLLVHKLQGWDDHVNAEEERYKAKAPVDVEDLKWMLNSRDRLSQRSASIAFSMTSLSRFWSNRALFSETFEALTRERVRKFSAAFPDYGREWKSLGFET